MIALASAKEGVTAAWQSYKASRSAPRSRDIEVLSEGVDEPARKTWEVSPT